MENKNLPSNDPFEEYQRESDPSKLERSYACYLQTKFARFLLSQAKIRQHGTVKTYKLVT